MRKALIFAVFAGVVAAATPVGAPASAGQAMKALKAFTGSAYAPLASQDGSGFGEAIAFTASSYTPEGISSLVYSPLSSQNLSGFGEAIVFVPSGYTPPGIGRLGTAVATTH